MDQTRNKKHSPNQETETEFDTTKLKNWKHIKSQELTDHVCSSLTCVPLGEYFHSFHSSASQPLCLYLDKTCYHSHSDSHSDSFLKSFLHESGTWRSCTIPGIGPAPITEPVQWSSDTRAERKATRYVSVTIGAERVSYNPGYQ